MLEANRQAIATAEKCRKYLAEISWNWEWAFPVPANSGQIFFALSFISVSANSQMDSLSFPTNFGCIKSGKLDSIRKNLLRDVICDSQSLCLGHGGPISQMFLNETIPLLSLETSHFFRALPLFLL